MTNNNQPQDPHHERAAGIHTSGSPTSIGITQSGIRLVARTPELLQELKELVEPLDILINKYGLSLSYIADEPSSLYYGDAHVYTDEHGKTHIGIDLEALPEPYERLLILLHEVAHLTDQRDWKNATFAYHDKGFRKEFGWVIHWYLLLVTRPKNKQRLLHAAERLDVPPILPAGLREGVAR